MRTMYYVAYGSNLDLDGFYKRCPSTKLLGKSLLSNKALVFKGEEEKNGYLTIEEQEGSIIPIGIFEIDYLDILKLDKYEGYPDLYSKQYLNINLHNQKIKALIYIMNDNYDYHLPSIAYFKTCIKGYEDFKFNKNILVKAIENTNEKKIKSR